MRAHLALAATVIAGIAACSSSASTPQPPLSGSASRLAPTTPAPTLAWDKTAFRVTGLPALARSGQLTLINVADNDAGRGYPNARVELRDRRDRVVETLRVLTADEFERLVPDSTTPSPELERRITAANERMAQLHADHDFLALRGHAAPEKSVGPKSPIEGDGLVVSFDADHKLRVRSQDGATLATVDGASWLAPSGKRCPQCPPCENPAYLDSFYKAQGHTTIVVRIVYAGTDTCWEPPDQWHVVGW